MDVIYKFVVPLIEMLFSLGTLAVYFLWKFNLGKWIQQTFRSCQRNRIEEANASAGCVVRQRWWVGVMVAFDILAIVFQWVLHVVSVTNKDDGTPMTKTFSAFKLSDEAPFTSLWKTLVSFSTFNQNIWTAVGVSIIGPLAIREMKSEQSCPIWAVIPFSFCLCVVPPYAFAGMALSGLVSSATIVTTFTILTIVAIVMMITSSLFIVLFIRKKQTNQHSSHAFDVVIELKKLNMRSSLKLMVYIVIPHLLLALAAAVLLYVQYMRDDESDGDGDSQSKVSDASLYEKFVVTFITLLAVVSFVKTVIFAMFCCGSRRRLCGVAS